ncbi:hypothetical protein EVAR_51897_1 [Eumeta japonica]|uniref:Uncharacterized protein n=1 Tax=Eumeta variegata TaxID=151549 RepID=A0A4C1XFE2_EUMVA|nr:hypothetical protein EVAR_51897_1 [Eumeta japonica]
MFPTRAPPPPDYRTTAEKQRPRRRALPSAAAYRACGTANCCRACGTCYGLIMRLRRDTLDTVFIQDVVDVHTTG